MFRVNAKLKVVTGDTLSVEDLFHKGILGHHPKKSQQTAMIEPFGMGPQKKYTGKKIKERDSQAPGACTYLHAPR